MILHGYITLNDEMGPRITAEYGNGIGKTGRSCGSEKATEPIDHDKKERSDKGLTKFNSNPIKVIRVESSHVSEMALLTGRMSVAFRNFTYYMRS